METQGGGGEHSAFHALRSTETEDFFRRETGVIGVDEVKGERIQIILDFGRS